MSTLALDIPFASEINLLVKAGLYQNPAEVITDAVRQLLIQNPHYRQEIAITAYQAEEISIGKAAEMAGLSYVDMMELLRSRGISLKLGPETEADAVAEIEAMREAAPL